MRGRARAAGRSHRRVVRRRAARSSPPARRSIWLQHDPRSACAGRVRRARRVVPVRALARHARRDRRRPRARSDVAACSPCVPMRSRRSRASTHVVLDKTGTLTFGRRGSSALEPSGGHRPRRVPRDRGGARGGVAHPIAHALVAARAASARWPRRDRRDARATASKGIVDGAPLSAAAGRVGRGARRGTPAIAAFARARRAPDAIVVALADDTRLARDVRRSTMRCAPGARALGRASARAAACTVTLLSGDGATPSSASRSGAASRVAHGELRARRTSARSFARASATAPSSRWSATASTTRRRSRRRDVSHRDGRARRRSRSGPPTSSCSATTLAADRRRVRARAAHAARHPPEPGLGGRLQRDRDSRSPPSGFVSPLVAAAGMSLSSLSSSATRCASARVTHGHPVPADSAGRRARVPDRRGVRVVVRSGQFDDLDGPAHRILADDDDCAASRALSVKAVSRAGRRSIRIARRIARFVRARARVAHERSMTTQRRSTTRWCGSSPS